MLYFARIKELRLEFKLSQSEICEYLICDQSLYSKYERGMRNVPLEIILKLVKYYDVSADYLLGLSDKRKH